MTVLITLTTAGTNTGPFDLYSDADGFVSAFATGVSKAALLAGYLSSAVPDATTIIRVKSTATCLNYIDIPLVIVTTTTSSTTNTSTSTTSTTTTEALCKTYTNLGATNWIGSYQDCNGVWWTNQTVLPNGIICAIQGTVITNTGPTLSITGSCNY